MMTEEELIKKCQKDKKYFDIFYSENYEKIFYYVRKYIKNKEHSEDITSMVFEKALRGIDNFQWEGISIQSWLYKIARNTINDFYRKKYNTHTLSINQKVNSKDGSSDMTLEDIIPSNEEGIELKVIKSDEEEHLYRILENLEENDQFLLYYKYFEDLTNKDIAKLMKLSETNVGTKLQRLRAKIKDILNKENGKI